MTLQTETWKISMTTPEQLYQQAQSEIQAQNLPAAAALLEHLLAQDLPAAPAGRFYTNLASWLQQVAQDARPSALKPPAELVAAQSWYQDLGLLARLQLAHVYWALAKTEAALSCLLELLATHPSAELYHLQGRWYFELGAHSEAAVAWHQALQQNRAYLPAYEDLATLANLNGDADLAYALIQQALSYQLTPRLLEELLLACSQTEYVPMRTLFLELCVQHIRLETQALLSVLLQKLFLEQDWHHASYLGFHLNQVFPEHEAILEIYVLSALHQGQFVPALQALWRAGPDLFSRGAQWFRLGVTYEQWHMPHFARHALTQAAVLEPELKAAVRQRLKSLPVEVAEAELLAEVLRQVLVSEAFKSDLQADPAQTLSDWGISPSAFMLEALQPFLSQNPA